MNSFLLSKIKYPNRSLPSKLNLLNNELVNIFPNMSDINNDHMIRSI